jgi:hypothetical protein
VAKRLSVARREGVLSLLRPPRNIRLKATTIAGTGGAGNCSVGGGSGSGSGKHGFKSAKRVAIMGHGKGKANVAMSLASMAAAGDAFPPMSHSEAKECAQVCAKTSRRFSVTVMNFEDVCEIRCVIARDDSKRWW